MNAKETKMKSIKTGKELAEKIFSTLKEVPWLKINGYSACYLYQMTKDTKLDYIILESARNEPFDLFINDVKALVNIMQKSPRGRDIYAYRINGVEHIFKVPFLNKITGTFDWKDAVEQKPEVKYRLGTKRGSKFQIYAFK